MGRPEFTSGSGIRNQLLNSQYPYPSGTILNNRILLARRTMLKEGDKAPDFKSKDQDGKPVKLSDFKGKRVVLFFYPKDDTPG